MFKRKTYNANWCYEEKSSFVHGNTYFESEKEALKFLKFIFETLGKKMVYYNIDLYINNKFKTTISSKQIIPKESK